MFPFEFEIAIGDCASTEPKTGGLFFSCLNTKRFLDVCVDFALFFYFLRTQRSLNNTSGILINFLSFSFVGKLKVDDWIEA